MKWVIASNKGIADISKPEELAPERLAGADYVFFPFWSWKIPPQIYENWECIVFHMTDLPFGRGGSPLQNLIERGIYETKISAIRVIEEMDAGPIYDKQDLALNGTARQIYERADTIIRRRMIPYIMIWQPQSIPQDGQPTIFKRRTPQQSNIANLSEPTKIYDYIRMLDADGYPHAFIQSAGLKIEFTEAKLKGDLVIATASIQ